MNKSEIKTFLEGFANKRERTIVIVDFGNVEKWKHSLNWKVDIKKLGQLVKNFSTSKKYLRRFYYGSDYGRSEKSHTIVPWSKNILQKAKMSGFELVTKRVKYIHDNNKNGGFTKKCDLDVEMTVDLIKERKNYDTIVLFSGDGDLMYAITYLSKEYQKRCIVFGARNHVGREVYDAKNNGVVDKILYAEDFDYRLSREAF